MKPAISFIVPVRNDAVRLETCLRSIQRNGHVPGQIEVIVVDNGSTDHSVDVARRFGAEVMVIEHARISDLRNQGARRARADVLAFVDADNEIVAGWVYVALNTLLTPKVAAVGSMYHAPEDGTWVQRSYGHLRGITPGQQDVDWLGSGNLAVTRAAFESVNGFDTSLETCEDVDFCHRLLQQGYRVISDARMKSIHHGDPRTLGEVLSGERWRGRDNLRVSFRRPIAWASVPSAIIPVVDAMLIALAVVGVVATFKAGWLGVAVTAAAVLLFAGPAVLRVFRAAGRAGRNRTVSLFQTFVVACVWDAGRALAIVSRAPHRAVRANTAEAAS